MNALSRSLSALVLVATCFGLSSCYTQLAADGTRASATDAYRLPADQPAQPEASAPTWNQDARVGLGQATEPYEDGYEDDYDYEDGYAEDDGAYAEGTYDGEAAGGYDDVEVTRYRYDDEYYDDAYYDDGYYGDGYYDGYPTYYYVSYAPYYRSHRWRWHYLYSPFYPAPAWAYHYDPFFDIRYRSGWGIGISFTFGSPFYGGYYYDPFYYDPYYGSYYGSSYYPSYYGGYHQGYHDGYASGYYNAGYYNGGHYNGSYNSGIRHGGPRGSIRSALGTDRTRLRSLAAYTEDRPGRVVLDSPTGIRSVRALASDTRQHVLEAQSVHTPVRTEAAVRAGDVRPDRTERVVDNPVRLAPQPDRTTRVSPPTRITPSVRPSSPSVRPNRTTRTAPPTRTAPQPDRPTRATRPPSRTGDVRPQPTRPPRTTRPTPQRPPRRRAEPTRRPRPEPSTRKPARRPRRSEPSRAPSRPAPRSTPSRSRGGSKSSPSRGSSRGGSARPSRSSGSSSRSSGRSSRGSSRRGGR